MQQLEATLAAAAHAAYSTGVYNRPAAARRARQAWNDMLRDVLAEFAEVLSAYQRQAGPPYDDAKLSAALDGLLARLVRPVLARRLRAGDVEDVLSEVRLGCWRYRYSIRAEEAGRFIHAVAHRKLADQLRAYYRESDVSAGNPDTAAGDLLSLLPAPEADQTGADDQRVWELLGDCRLGDVDLLVAYLLYLGTAKGEIAAALGISPNTVTNALKRCREQLAAAGLKPAGGTR